MPIDLSSIKPLTATLPPRILVHGREGVGKTTLASRFPGPVILDTEGGVPSGILIPGLAIRGYEDMLTAITALGGEHGYRTVVLDSVDALEPHVWAATCAELGCKSIESVGYGKGYVEADRLWQRILAGLDWLRARGMTVVLLAHSQPELVNDPRAPSYTSYQLRTHRRARGLLQDWADAIGFLACDVHVFSEEIGFETTPLGTALRVSQRRPLGSLSTPSSFQDRQARRFQARLVHPRLGGSIFRASDGRLRGSWAESHGMRVSTRAESLAYGTTIVERFQ